MAGMGLGEAGLPEPAPAGGSGYLADLALRAMRGLGLAAPEGAPTLGDIMASSGRDQLDLLRDHGGERLRDVATRPGQDPRDLEIAQQLVGNFAAPMAAQIPLSKLWPVHEPSLPTSYPKGETPSARTQAAAQAYKDEAGITTPGLEGKLEAPTDYLKSVADWMDGAQHAPNDPAVRRSYDALGRETEAQFKALRDRGVRVVPWDGKGEPYASSAQMAADVEQNNRLYYLKTANAFGEGSNGSGNPMERVTKYSPTTGGDPMLLNDLFRVVHDYFGHTQNGFKFGGQGEYNAYHEHARMFSPEAVPALAGETLAQNAWVNFGPHLRRADGSIPKIGDTDYVPLTDRPFSEQKNVVVPPELLALDPSSATSPNLTIRDLQPGERIVGSGRNLEELQARLAGLPEGHELTKHWLPNIYAIADTRTPEQLFAVKPPEGEGPFTFSSERVPTHDEIMALAKRATSGVNQVPNTGVNGQYDYRRNAITLDSGMDQATLERVLPHELGHGLAFRGGLLGEGNRAWAKAPPWDVGQQIEKLSADQRPHLWGTPEQIQEAFPHLTPEMVQAYRMRPDELAADLVSSMMRNPAKAKEIGPDAYRWAADRLNASDIGKIARFLGLPAAIVASQLAYHQQDRVM